MKTITEFPAPNLKNAIQTRQNLLTAGKTAEELPQAMGEALKLEGDKLGRLLLALEVIEGRTGDLKRVVVFSLAENEKAPQHAQQKGEHYYLAEYYPPLVKEHRHDHRGFKGRGDRDRKGGKGRGRRGDRRGERSMAPAGTPGAGGASGKPENAGRDNEKRENRGRRRPPHKGPRPQNAPKTE